MQIKNLTMSFGTQVLFENINLNIPENEKIGVVGVNGAGKTTFFKIVMGLEYPVILCFLTKRSLSAIINSYFKSVIWRSRYLWNL